MPLPPFEDEAGMRALEPKCASPTSSTSKRTVAQLSKLTLECKEIYLNNAVCLGLSNIVRCALEAKISANTHVGGEVKRPVLTAAAFDGYTRILKLLLDAGANHSLADDDGDTALVLAASEGHLDCVRLLLAAGADANKTDSLGASPLMNAIMSRRRECVRALLPASNLLATNRMGRSALHVCATTANGEAFELLLPLVSDVDHRSSSPGVDGYGRTISVVNSTTLHFACERGQQQMARALLKRGANRMARDSLQRTPLIWAAQGHLSCVVLLIGQPGRRKLTPAEVNATDEKGWTALLLAAEQGNDKICGFLLEAGARLDVKTSEGATPLMVAQQRHPTNAALLALLSGNGPAQPPGTVCDHCGKTAAQASVSSLKGCAQCHAVRYCGAACSAAAWPGHKKACKARAKEREERTRTTPIFSPGATAQAPAPPGSTQS